MNERGGNRARVRGDADWPFWLARDCQVIAGEALNCDPSVLFEKTRELLTRVPQHTNGADQAVAALLLTKTVRGIVRHASLETEPAVVALFLRLAPPSIATAWRQSMQELIECCLTMHRTHVDGPSRVAYSVIVRRTLAVIERHYVDPDFGLHKAAALVGASRHYISRQIKRETSLGFVDHLRRRRVAAARDLIRHGALSVKEIAAMVGYGSRRKFERDVKRLCQVPPSALVGSTHVTVHGVSHLRNNRRAL